MLYFIALAQTVAKWNGFRDRQAEAFKRLGSSHYFSHLSFNGREVVFREMLARNVHIVIKAVCGGRAESEFNAWVNPHDGSGHDVGGAVAEHVERFTIAGGQQFQFNRFASGFRGLNQWAVQIYDPAIGDGGDSGLSETGTDGLCNLARSDVGCERLFVAIWKTNADHGENQISRLVSAFLK